MADRLIEAGAHVDAANNLWVTPLSLACANRNARIVERLLQAGANPSATFPKRPPAIMLCARSGSVDGVRALLDHGAEVNAREPLRDQTALMWAAAREHPAVVRVLLEHGADVWARSAVTDRMVNRADPNDVFTAVVGEVPDGGGTPLLFAARHGDVQSATLLLDAGADVNDTAADRASALVIAAHSGHSALATLLLARGADPNRIDAGYTALHAAVLRGDLELVKGLLAHGAAVDAAIRHGTTTIRAGRGFVLPENLVGATPFLLAAKFLEIDIMRLLASRDAGARLTLRDRTTALMLAAGAVSQGPLFDRRGRIAVLAISDEGVALEAVRLTLELGAQVNAANAQGDTALHGAATRGYSAIVRLLLDRGARHDARNAQGETPADVAGGAAVRDVLASSGAER